MRTRVCWRASSVLRVQGILGGATAGDTFHAVHECGEGDFWRESDEEVNVVRFTVELLEFAFVVGCNFAEEFFHANEASVRKNIMPIFSHEDKVCM